MNDMERLDNGLKALREADAGRGASKETESLLLAAFREHHATRSRRWRPSLRGLAAVAAAAVVAVLAVTRLISPPGVQAPPALARREPVLRQPPGGITKVGPAVPSVQARAVPKRSRTPMRRPEPESPPVTVSSRPNLDDFMAIPYAPPFMLHDQGQVVRVRVPRQSLRSLGLPVNEDRMFERVPADLLMGEDGVPRAIRFVNDRR